MTVQCRSVGSRFSWLCLAAGVLLLAGCNNMGAGPAASGARVFAADVTGAAKSCTAATPALKDGQVTETTMKVGNDGGWCGISVEKGGKPFNAGLLTGRPTHGKVFIHTVGDVTRVDYTPDRGFVGTDTFIVKLLPGSAGFRTAVTVTGP
ncbi:MAG: hypothetical protein J0H67_01775 [Rhodospirillales bacterium]|nr:hypothetical protein [Rhodospirillales bacterium]